MEETKHREFWFLDGRVTIVLSQDDNADRLSVLRHDVPLGHAPPWHVHHEEDEVFQILEGRLRFKSIDGLFEEGAGATVFLPRGVAHGFRVVSPEGASFLTITRGQFEPMVRSVARPAEGDGLPAPEPVTPEVQARLAAACTVHGIDLLGPPID